MSYWTITDIPFPLFNSILGAHLNPDIVATAITSAVTRGQSRNVPLLWWTGPATRPSDLGSTLTTYGFVHSSDIPGMALDILHLREDFSIVPGLVIEPVQDTTTLHTWCQTLVAGFGMPDFVTNAFFALFSDVGFDAHPLPLNYLGWWHGSPVATMSLCLGAGVVGIYNVATVPSARRNGIGAAMTCAPLSAARAYGYRIAILHAAPMGVGVYRRMGFRDYCTIGQYVWSPSE